MVYCQISFLSTILGLVGEIFEFESNWNTLQRFNKEFSSDFNCQKRKKALRTNDSKFKPGTNHNPSIDGHDSSELYKILLQNIKSFKQHQYDKNPSSYLYIKGL